MPLGNVSGLMAYKGTAKGRTRCFFSSKLNRNWSKTEEAFVIANASMLVLRSFPPSGRKRPLLQCLTDLTYKENLSYLDHQPNQCSDAVAESSPINFILKEAQENKQYLLSDAALPRGEYFSTNLSKAVGLCRKVVLFSSYDFLIHSNTTLHKTGKITPLSSSRPDRLQWRIGRYPTSSPHCTEKRFEVEENKTYVLPHDFFTTLICFTLSAVG